MSRAGDAWRTLGAWWLAELASDPAYEDEITPLVLDLAHPVGRILDVGCGEGRLMKSIAAAGAEPFGMDLAEDLLRIATRFGPAVRGGLPGIGFFEDGSFDGAVMSLVLEHIEDHETLLSELARVVRPAGVLTIVMNHPIYTAPGSAPIDEPDGEVLWRPGEYFGRGFTDEPAGVQRVRFHHRPTGELLTAAAAAGWMLERMVELGVTASQIERHPPLAKQTGIPRLLGIRWTKR